MTIGEGKKELSDRYMDLYAYAFSLLRNKVDAEDVLHDALVETLSRSWLRNPYGYCLRTIRNNALTLLNEQGVYHQLKEDLVEGAPESTNKEEAMKVALSSLEPQLQELLKMHDVLEMSMLEISKETGLSLSNVKRMISKAHKILKRKLK